MNRRTGSLVEGLMLTAAAGVSLVVMLVVTCRLVASGAHPASIMLMVLACIADVGITVSWWRRPRR